MAKTIEQIQGMITIGGDVRQVVNEIADYLEANPPGEGGGAVVGFPEGTKIYTALLTQTGTNAPVAIVLQNTLGGSIVWTRQGAGDYIGTLAGVFTENKTVFLITGDNDSASGTVGVYGAARTSVNTINVISSSAVDQTPLDGILEETTVEIRVYP